MGEVFRKLAAKKESRIEEGHLMQDHVHMLSVVHTEAQLLLHKLLHSLASEPVFSTSIRKLEPMKPVHGRSARPPSILLAGNAGSDGPPLCPR